MSLPLRALPALIPVFALVACGGNGGGGATEPEADGRSVRAAVATVPAGNPCPSGGYRIDSGLDSNGNGQLDGTEVTASQVVCNGEPGADGAAGPAGPAGAAGVAALVRTSAEPAGAACAHGGVRVAAGLDSNGNGVLDPAEESVSEAVCHGAGSIAWEEVSAASVQMAPNRGYIAGNASQAVELILPASPAIGDIVQVTGRGAGGWRLAQNAGQQINLAGLKGGWSATWAEVVAPGAGTTAVASSADGCRLASSAGTSVRISANCGITWGSVNTAQPVFELASSGSGQVLLATYGDPAAGGATSYGALMSVDGGATWTAPFAASLYAAPGHYRLGAVSRSGSTLVIADGTTLHRSTDGGQNWAATAAPALVWRSIAVSDNGQKIAAVADGSAVWISEDGGANWTSRGATLAWRQIVMTADGSKLGGAADGAPLQFSANGGVTWATANSARAWTALAMSDDGRYLIGATGNDMLYSSRDGGLVWRSVASSSAWRSLAMSADGRSLLAAGSLGAMHSLTDTRPGSLGYLMGTSDEAIELQYVGGGRFNVVDWTGIFLAR